MKNVFKLALLGLLAYIGLAYYAGSQNVLSLDFVDKPLPTWSFTPRGTVAPIGTPSVPDSHGVLEAVWPTDPYGKQFYPLGNGYPNNTSYPLLTNNYPL